MSDDKKDSKEKSLLNPLHGGDNYKAAMSLRDEEFTSLRHEDVEDKVDAKNVNKIVIICSIFVVIWLFFYGLFYLASMSISKNNQSQDIGSSGYSAQPQSFFQRTFCKGARRSSFCD